MVWNTIANVMTWMGIYTAPIVLLNTPSGNPVTETTNLATLSTQVMDFILSSYSNDDGRTLDYIRMKSDEDFTFNMQNLYDHLETQEPSLLNLNQRKTFFINLYNILTINAILSLDELPESTRSVPSFWRTFAYRISGTNFTLDLIEHGILRGNKPHLDGTSFIKADQEVAKLIVPFDRRIHAAVNCGAMSCPRLNSYSTEVINTQLDVAMQEFCKDAVKIRKNGDKTDIAINMIFSWFEGDFGANKTEVLRFISECTDTAEKKKALIDASNKMINYHFTYDWDLNLAETARARTSKIESGFRNNAPL